MADFKRKPLPEELKQVQIRNLRVGDASVDLSFERYSETVGVNILRRSGAVANTSSRLRFADLELDEDTREVTRGPHPIELTATEYRLLRYLLLNPRRVLTRAQLLDHVWSYDFGGDARVLETYISYLRKKLDIHGPPLVHTVRGVGYALRLPRD